MADNSANNPNSGISNQAAEEKSILNAGISDQATEEDYLGFEPYVTAIAEFLTNPVTKPPLTISIEGAWGRANALK